MRPGHEKLNILDAIHQQKSTQVGFPNGYKCILFDFNLNDASMLNEGLDMHEIIPARTRITLSYLKFIEAYMC